MSSFSPFNRSNGFSTSTGSVPPSSNRSRRHLSSSQTHPKRMLSRMERENPEHSREELEAIQPLYDMAASTRSFAASVASEAMSASARSEGSISSNGQASRPPSEFVKILIENTKSPLAEEERSEYDFEFEQDPFAHAMKQKLAEYTKTREKERLERRFGRKSNRESVNSRASTPQTPGVDLAPSKLIMQYRSSGSSIDGASSKLLAQMAATPKRIPSSIASSSTPAARMAAISSRIETQGIEHTASRRSSESFTFTPYQSQISPPSTQSTLSSTGSFLTSSISRAKAALSENRQQQRQFNESIRKEQLRQKAEEVERERRERVMADLKHQEELERQKEAERAERATLALEALARKRARPTTPEPEPAGGAEVDAIPPIGLDHEGITKRIKLDDITKAQLDALSPEPDLEMPDGPMHSKKRTFDGENEVLGTKRSRSREPENLISTTPKYSPQQRRQLLPPTPAPHLFLTPPAEQLAWSSPVQNIDPQLSSPVPQGAATPDPRQMARPSAPTPYRATHANELARPAAPTPFRAMGGPAAFDSPFSFGSSHHKRKFTHDSDDDDSEHEDQGPVNGEAREGASPPPLGMENNSYDLDEIKDLDESALDRSFLSPSPAPATALQTIEEEEIKDFDGSELPQTSLSPPLEPREELDSDRRPMHLIDSDDNVAPHAENEHAVSYDSADSGSSSEGSEDDQLEDGSGEEESSEEESSSDEEDSEGEPESYGAAMPRSLPSGNEAIPEVINLDTDSEDDASSISVHEEDRRMTNGADDDVSDEDEADSDYPEDDYDDEEEDLVYQDRPLTYMQLDESSEESGDDQDGENVVHTEGRYVEEDQEAAAAAYLDDDGNIYEDGVEEVSQGSPVYEASEEPEEVRYEPEQLHHEVGRHDKEVIDLSESDHEQDIDPSFMGLDEIQSEDAAKEHVDQSSDVDEEIQVEQDGDMVQIPASSQTKTYGLFTIDKEEDDMPLVDPIESSEIPGNYVVEPLHLNEERDEVVRDVEMEQVDALNPVRMRQYGPFFIDKDDVATPPVEPSQMENAEAQPFVTGNDDYEAPAVLEFQNELARVASFVDDTEYERLAIRHPARPDEVPVSEINQNDPSLATDDMTPADIDPSILDPELPANQPVSFDRPLYPPLPVLTDDYPIHSAESYEEQQTEIDSENELEGQQTPVRPVRIGGIHVEESMGSTVFLSMRSAGGLKLPRLGPSPLDQAVDHSAGSFSQAEDAAQSLRQDEDVGNTDEDSSPENDHDHLVDGLSEDEDESSDMETEDVEGTASAAVATDTTFVADGDGTMVDEVAEEVVESVEKTVDVTEEVAIEITEEVDVEEVDEEGLRALEADLESSDEEGEDVAGGDSIAEDVEREDVSDLEADLESSDEEDAEDAADKMVVDLEQESLSALEADLESSDDDDDEGATVEDVDEAAVTEDQGADSSGKEEVVGSQDGSPGNSDQEPSEKDMDEDMDDAEPTEPDEGDEEIAEPEASTDTPAITATNHPSPPKRTLRNRVVQIPE